MQVWLGRGQGRRAPYRFVVSGFARNDAARPCRHERADWPGAGRSVALVDGALVDRQRGLDRKSTRLNSSHVEISYAVFCLKKKKKKNTTQVQNTLRRIYHSVVE